MDRSLFERMSSLGPVTSADEAVAGYLEASFPEIAFQNLAQIADGAGVSVASVTRLVRKLGYADFKDFSQAVRDEVAANFDRPSQRGIENIPDGSGAELVAHLRRATLEVERTLETISLASFDAVADLLADESRPLFLASTATGRALLEYFYLLAKYHRSGIHLLRGPDMAAHELLDLAPGAVLFVTAFDRHPRPVEAALRAAQGNGVTTVLLTNRATSSLRMHADLVLVVVTEATSRFKSRATMVLVMESLLAAMERRAPERTFQRTQHLEGLIDEMGLYRSPSA